MSRFGLSVVAKFAVGLPYGNKDSEFQAYVRLRERNWGLT